MKEVSFKVAKAIKEAGYPQGKGGDVFIVKASNGWNEGEELSYLDAWHDSVPDDCLVCAPTYLDVWLWLWREKKIAIGCHHENTYNYWFTNINAENDKSLILWKYSSGECNDPEEAIISAIEYLVNNDLIK